MARRPRRNERYTAPRTSTRNAAGREEGQAPGWAPWVAPWAMAPGAMTVSAIAHGLVAGNPATMSVAVLATAGSGYGLTRYMLKLGTKLPANKKQLYTANASAITAGTTLTVMAGLNAQSLSAWAIGGLVLGLANNIHRLVGGGKETATTKGAKWAKVEDAVGLAKFEVEGEPTTNGKGTVAVTLVAQEGAAGEDFARKIPQLASVLRLGRGRMTAVVDPEDSAKVYVRAQVADLLVSGVGWGGPTAPGQSIAAARIWAGRYDDGEDVEIDITALEDGVVKHLLVMGMTGAGKTQWGRAIVADILTRTEVSVWYLNTTKAMQDFGPLRHGIDWFITEEAKAKQFFKLLKNVITARTNYLASKGLASWRPGCGINFLVIWGEEAADFASDSAAYDHLLRTARSAGIWIVTSLQRATYTNISTDARANHGSGMCFGLQDASDAGFVLPGDVIEAGASPGWGAKKPGYAYLAGLGTAEERWANIMRGPFATAEMLANAVTDGAQWRTPLDEVTATAAGAVYANRTTYDTPLLPGQVDGAVVTLQKAPPEIEEIEDMDEEMARNEVEELTEMFDAITTLDPEPGEFDHLTIDSEVEEPGDDGAIELGHPGGDEQITTEEGEARMEQMLDRWIREGRTQFGPSDLKDIWLLIEGNGRAKFNRWIKKMTAAKVIARDEETSQGSYDILRSPLTDLT
ncbi:hypothetical protein AB0O82_32685 [Kitasatospora sp. NPDC088264]|uniref:hypothetical protein n=1 Tax=Kitasatospora sp. NPDC088264 TaxID=3155296 RepID=UPI0034205C80